MRRIFSNGPERDFVQNPFTTLLRDGKSLQLAAPYFTRADEILEADAAGKSIKLLIGLNSATHPEAVTKVRKRPNIAVRYLTDRFHAKIFLSEDQVILGSANLTDGGLVSNREAAILLDRPEDVEAADQVRAVFQDLWESASTLTDAVLDQFRATWQASPRTGWLPSGSDGAIGVAGSADRNGAIVHAEVAGDGVVVEIVLDRLRDFAEQTLIDELDGEVVEAVDLIEVDIETIGIVSAEIEAVSDPIARGFPKAPAGDAGEFGGKRPDPPRGQPTSRQIRP